MIFFWLALFGAAGVYALVQNIGAVILAVVILSVVFFLFSNWPIQTAIGTIIAIILGAIAFNIYSNSEINNTPVTIYQATDNCIIYNEEHELIQIPEGAIVARYRDPERKSNEISVMGHSDMCVWYANGQVNTTTVSINHGMDYWIKELDYEPNEWNLLVIKEITYKEFQKGTWWVN